MWHITNDELKAGIRVLTFAHSDGRTASGSYYHRRNLKRSPSLNIYRDDKLDDRMTWDDDWVDEKDMLEILHSKFAE